MRRLHSIALLLVLIVVASASNARAAILVSELTADLPGEQTLQDVLGGEPAVAASTATVLGTPATGTPRTADSLDHVATASSTSSREVVDKGPDCV
jgi:hypothetical protein